MSHFYRFHTSESTKPTLHYFDVSGRGELSKLIAAVGGVEIDVKEYPFEVCDNACTSFDTTAAFIWL